MATFYVNPIHSDVNAVLTYMANPEKMIASDTIPRVISYMSDSHSIEKTYTIGMNGCPSDKAAAAKIFAECERRYNERNPGKNIPRVTTFTAKKYLTRSKRHNKKYDCMTEEQCAEILKKRKLPDGTTFEHGVVTQIRKPVTAHHIFISFTAEDHPTDSQMQEIIFELSKIDPDFPSVANRHFNTSHRHIHWLISNYSIDGTKKFCYNNAKGQQYKKALNRICVQYGLSIIDDTFLKKYDLEYQSFIEETKAMGQVIIHQNNYASHNNQMIDDKNGAYKKTQRKLKKRLNSGLPLHDGRTADLGYYGYNFSPKRRLFNRVFMTEHPAIPYIVPSLDLEGNPLSQIEIALSFQIEVLQKEGDYIKNKSPQQYHGIKSRIQKKIDAHRTALDFSNAHNIKTFQSARKCKAQLKAEITELKYTLTSPNRIDPNRYEAQVKTLREVSGNYKKLCRLCEILDDIETNRSIDWIKKQAIMEKMSLEDQINANKKKTDAEEKKIRNRAYGYRYGNYRIRMYDDDGKPIPLFLLTYGLIVAAAGRNDLVPSCILSEDDRADEPHIFFTIKDYKVQAMIDAMHIAKEKKIYSQPTIHEQKIATGNQIGSIRKSIKSLEELLENPQIIGENHRLASVALDAYRKNLVSTRRTYKTLCAMERNALTVELESKLHPEIMNPNIQVQHKVCIKETELDR